MRFFFGLLCLAAASQAKTFITFDEAVDSRTLLQCNDASAISCRKVNVDLDLLLTAETLSLPDELIGMTRSLSSRSEQSHLTFENTDELLQGVFVHGLSKGQHYVAGSINWAKSGRHFRLETCSEDNSETSCFLWKEIDPNFWARLGEAEPKQIAKTRQIAKTDLMQTLKEKMLIEAARADTTTMTRVSISIYTTREFRDSFASVKAMEAFIDLAIAETNQGYVNSKVPITLFLHCIMESSLPDSGDLGNLLDQFTRQDTPVNTRKGADIGVLLTLKGDYCGIAWFNVMRSGQTLGVVQKGCATGYYSFAHEMGHMYGLDHNQENAGKNGAYAGGNGFLMRPPINSGYRTILAYTDPGYQNRINFYSSDSVQYNGIPTGDADDNNAKILTDNRMLMAAVANEGTSCSGGTQLPVDGKWGEWSAWGECNAPCGGGTQTRARQCNSPAPAGSGKPCDGSSSESKSCNTDPCSKIVFLEGGKKPYEGNVHALNPVTKFYGPVCDDLWSFADANVACKQMGFKDGAITIFSNSYFGNVKADFAYDDVNCTGSEATLDACPHNNKDDCSENEGAGVICVPNVESVILLGGNKTGSGNVYARNPRTKLFGPVCDDYWTINDAHVVCRQLGYSGALNATVNSTFGYVRNNFSFDDVKCSGNEADLSKCPHADVHDCGAQEAAGVICNTSNPAGK